MPYSNVNSLPAYVKKYSEKVKRQWRHVFNSVYKKYGDEKRAFAAANSVLRRRLSSTKNTTHKDRFQLLVDMWLGNVVVKK